ncbi:MAG: AAA family ATPase [Polyangiaceae bacterium]
MKPRLRSTTVESPVATSAQTASLPFGRPSMFGPYRALDVLARGGMGVVFRAEHVETAEAVAIKTAVDSRADHLAAMRREIPALRRLRHPGVVRIIDDGETDGVPWIAMPLLQGRTLRQHIVDLHARSTISRAEDTGDSLTWRDDRGWGASTEAPPRRPLPRPLGPTLTVLSRLCNALAYLHGEGLVHRDLKPANVLLQDGDHPVLIDLGLALHFGGGGREELDVDLPGGTESYVAPEQIAGETVDARADLYSLGCILYECLTGSPPFRRPNVLEQHLWRRPVPPSERLLDVPQGLEDLVLKLLEKHPEDRTGSASAVTAALVALGATRGPEEAPPARPYLYRSGFKGREDALNTLGGLARRVVDRTCSAVALVRGESGLGKTRLVREIARRFARECQVLTGTCDAPGAGEVGAKAVVAAPLQPLRSALLQALDRRRPDSPGSARTLAPQRELLAAYLPELRERGSGAGQLPATTGTSQRAQERVIAAARDALRDLAASSPVLVVLDDLQWADELTLGVLGALSREDGEEHPGLLVMGTLRIEEPREELDSLARSQRVTTVDLRELDARNIEEMVAGMLAHSAPPRAALDALLHSADGNPFFVAQFLLTAIEEGILRRDKDGRLLFDEGVVPGALTSGDLPRTVTALLNRRLDLLDPDVRRLAGWAALLGHELEDELLFAGPFQRKAAIEAIATLQSRRILEEAEGRLQFSHDKLREAAYQRLDEGERRELHLCAAEALLSRHGEEPERAPVLAHHFAGAGRHEKAGEHYALAARHAAAVYAFRDAVRFYPLALESFERHGTGPKDPAAFHEGFADALRLLGQQEKARDAYSKALKHAPSSVDRARLHRKIGNSWERHHEHAEALACYSRAERALGKPRERTDAWQNEWLEIQFDRTSVRYWQANVKALDRLLATIRPAVQRAGTGLYRAHYLHAETQRDILSRRFVASKSTVRLASECLDLFKRASKKPDEDWVLVARCSLAIVLLLQGDIDRAEQELSDAQAAAVKSGDLATQARCLTYLTVCQRRRGIVSPVAQLSLRTLELTEEANLREYSGAALGNLAWCALRRRALDEAEEHARSALELWGKLRLNYPFQWLARLPLCQVELERGRLSGAIAEAEAVSSELQQRLPRPLERGLRAAVRAFAAHRAGDATSALRAVLRAGRKSGHT